MTNTQPYRDDFGATIYNANSLELLKELPDNSIDSIVTDPPYEIGFMGRGWDATGIAYNIELWKECLRVLKPGGHALVFGATRTYHRVAVAIEDAGFEIRDSIHWMYGSGFPKSMDISKAIDKQAGAERTEVVGQKRYGANSLGASTGWNVGPSSWGTEQDITAPATDAAKQWAGWGTALKPAHEPIVVARKPVVGTVANNVLTYGVGGLNIDGSRVGSTVETWPVTRARPIDSKDLRFDYTGSATETVSTGDAPSGRFPANILLTHSADCELVGKMEETTGGSGGPSSGDADFTGRSTGNGGNTGSATTHVYQCAPGCPAAMLDQQSGVLTSGSRKAGEYGLTFTPEADQATSAKLPELAASTGGASRFFTNTEADAIDEAAPFYYSGKAPKKERPIHPVTGKGHPTVKPLEVMRWLIKLVTPTGGTVLEPFAGSGATVEAALLDGFKIIAIDLEADHMPLIDARINRWARGESPVKAKKAKTASAASIAAKSRPEAAETLFDVPDDGEVA